MLSYIFDITTQPAFISLFMSSVTSLSGILIVNIKQISQIVLMSHLSPFNKQIPTGHYHVSFAFRRYFHKALQKTRIMNKNNDYSILSIYFMSQTKWLPFLKVGCIDNSSNLISWWHIRFSLRSKKRKFHSQV